MNLQFIEWSALDSNAQSHILTRPTQRVAQEVETTVAAILHEVKHNKDAALRALTQKYDNVMLENFAVSDTEFSDAVSQVPFEVQAALQEAKKRIITFHEAGMQSSYQVTTAPGVVCEKIVRSIPSVGLYIPGGSAPLVSTVLMLGIPAQLAGCPKILLCTPAQNDGTVHPAILYAAQLVGVKHVFKLGGAQAIAAMAYGTQSITKCNKIFGPGNHFVTAAKQQVSLSGTTAIDMPAGPSEVMVIADAMAHPEFVAADLLSQAEHGADSDVVLASDSKDLLVAVLSCLQTQLEQLPRRALAEKTLQNARLILVSSIEEACSISNQYAPEHLILALRNPRSWLPSLHSAGSIFLGDYTPEALGDYCSGTNHVLPTNGAAFAYSGVSVGSFQTQISVQSATRSGLYEIGKCAKTLALTEGLHAHAYAVTCRMESADGY